MQRKVFRPLTAHVVEKQFIGHDDATPAGWHDTQSAALAAHAASGNENAAQAPADTPKRRGRPRKVAQ